MKRFVLGLLLSVALMGSAEAGVGTILKNSWTYATSPVNCVVNLGTALVGAVAEFGRCFVANMNRNPVSLGGPLIPLLPGIQ